MTPDSVGMIEAHGLAASLVVADVAVKAAAVEAVGGKLILAHTIARPHEELARLLPKHE